MGQAWIITHKPKQFVDSSKTKNLHHDSVLLLGKLYKGSHVYRRYERVQGKGRNAHGFPLFSQMQGTEVLVLLN